MENKIDIFNPTEAQLMEMAHEYTGLTIEGVDDVNGYKLVHEAKMKLVKAKTTIKKIGKSEREESIAYQKAVITRERELLAIIEPVEIELANKIDAIDEEKEILKRQAKLPGRKIRLAEIGFEIADEHIVLMDDQTFDNWLNEKQAEILEAKRMALEAEREKIEAEKKAIQDAKDAEEREKVRQAELEEARNKAVIESQQKADKDAEIAKQKAEQDKKDAVEAERNRAEDERRRLVEDQDRKERERIEAEEKARQAEKEETEKLEKHKKYQKFLTDNDAAGASLINMDSPLSGDPIVYRVGNTFTLYKKVGEVKI